MFFKKLKEDVKYLEESLDRYQDRIEKIQKTLRILIEYLETTAPEEEKKTLRVLGKTLSYWG